jgi:hypothetical protein
MFYSYLRVDEEEMHLKKGEKTVQNWMNKNDITETRSTSLGIHR